MAVECVYLKNHFRLELTLCSFLIYIEFKFNAKG